MISCQFKLKDFDGPLDLLLMLIDKAKIDIRDIFVSEITNQYLTLVRNAPDLNMEEASDFLVMAATLLEIKSRAMLPKPPPPEEDEEDPEQELIRRLEEYRRFRETADSMKRFEKAAAALFTKLPEEYPLPPQEVELTGLTLEGLTQAIARILARRPPEEETEGNRYGSREFRRDSFTVQECMLNLIQCVKRRKHMRFEDALSEAVTREEVVTYFLAVLELLRLGRMHLTQRETYGEIELIYGRVQPEPQRDEPEPRKRRKPKQEEGNSE